MTGRGAGRIVTREAIDYGLHNPDNGVTLLQVTSGTAQCTAIYSEISYGDVSGRYFIYRKGRSPISEGGAHGFWRFDLEAMENTFVAEPEDLIGCTVPLDQTRFVYSRWEDERTVAVNFVDIATLKTETRLVKADRAWGLSTANAVTEDGRYVAAHAKPSQRRHCLCVLDTERGTSELIGEYTAEFCNPHLVLDPSGSGDVLMQINRGSTLNRDGSVAILMSPEGPRHDIFNIHSGAFRRTRAGYPYTTVLGGHSSWLGRTGKYVTNGLVMDLEELAQGGVISAIGYYADMEKRESRADIVPNYYPAHLEMTRKVGSLFVLDRLEDVPRAYGQGYYCGHPNASRDGKYFCADVLGDHLLVIGSFRTGRTEVLIHGGASMGGSHNTQPVPWFMPGNRHIIFTSDDSGIAQVCAAGIPPELLKRLDEE